MNKKKKKKKYITSCPHGDDVTEPPSALERSEKVVGRIKTDDSPLTAQSCAGKFYSPTGQLGRMNDGVERFRSQLQKELWTRSVRHPLLAWWVSPKKLL